MSPNELTKQVRSQLKANADRKFREGLVWFFKEPVDPYGVRTPQVRRIAAFAYKAVKSWPPAARDRFCDLLWKSGRMEEGGIAIYVYRRFRKQCATREFRLFETWTNRYVGNWAHCDGVASWLIAACIENEPELIGRLFPWARSKNRWKRRAAAVSLLQEAKQGRNTMAVLSIAAALVEDADDMVRKGVGWLLKEAYPKRPREVMKFVRACQHCTPRQVLRIAAEKMTAQDRAGALGRTG